MNFCLPLCESGDRLAERLRYACYLPDTALLTQRVLCKVILSTAEQAALSVNHVLRTACSRDLKKHPVYVHFVLFQVVLLGIVAAAAARPSHLHGSIAAPAVAAYAAPAVTAYTAPVATAVTKTVQYASTPVVTGYTSQVKI
jgi:hypothetical protein